MIVGIEEKAYLCTVIIYNKVEEVRKHPHPIFNTETKFKVYEKDEALRS